MSDENKIAEAIDRLRRTICIVGLTLPTIWLAMTLDGSRIKRIGDLTERFLPAIGFSLIITGGVTIIIWIVILLYRALSTPYPDSEETTPDD
ncbi:MAG: hypothetical protein ACSHYF_04820 [Verrucomicrobiaceae bacterium]